MPTANLIRAACFALGAAVGGGAVAVGMAARRREEPVAAGEASTSIADGAYQHNNVRKSEPFMKTTPSGLPDLVNTAELTAGPAGAILKYGHPGVLRSSCFFFRLWPDCFVDEAEFKALLMIY